MGRAGGPGHHDRAACSVLTGHDSRLVDRYRGIVCDLDGVVYRGRAAVPGGVQTLHTLAREGFGIAFATNNASRTPGEIRGHLRDLGLDLPDAVLVTSAHAAAAHVAAAYPAGTAVLAIGGPGVAAALRACRLRPVAAREYGEPPPVVVQGAGPDVSWSDLAEAAFAIQAGASWVATNDDLTIPVQRGLAPGNGTLVNAVRAATGTEPVVVGKPRARLFELAVEQLGLERAEVLAIGDRVDTDVAGARSAGLDSLLVLSGAHGLADLGTALAGHLPTYVADDLAGLLAPPAPASSRATHAAF